MYSTLTSSSHHPLFFNFPLRHSKPKTSRFPRNPSFFLQSSYSSPLPIPPTAVLHRVVRCSVVDNKSEKEKKNNEPPELLPSNSKRRSNENENALAAVAKPFAFAIFYVILGFLCPVFGFPKSAFAVAPNAAANDLLVWKQDDEKGGHKYSHCTRRLLEVVSRLLKRIEEVRNSGREDFATYVEEGLKEVRVAKGSLQEEIMNGLYAESRVLNREKEELMHRSEEIVEKAFKVKREQRESLTRKGKRGGDRIERIREESRSLENEYNELWERIGEIEDLIARKEFVALSIGVRELSFIERECEGLVADFLKEMRRRHNQR